MPFYWVHNRNDVVILKSLCLFPDSICLSVHKNNNLIRFLNLEQSRLLETISRSKRLSHDEIANLLRETSEIESDVGHACSHPRVPRAHQAVFRRRSLAGVGLSESGRSHEPGLALLTNGGVQQQQHIEVKRRILIQNGHTLDNG
ncbi:hypothetical protein TNCV_1932901 [Trichonephila clavipes]|nr:hypothetical protein TNCV_1932901 [Trichonephila clavipes]